VGGDGLVERAVGRAEEGAVRTTGLDDDGRDSRLGAEVHREVSVVFHTPMVAAPSPVVNPPPCRCGKSHTVDSAAECPLRRGFRGGSSSPAADSTVKGHFDRGFRSVILELPEGIEPSSMDYKSIVLPLN
jgi:hypothetical protein